MSSSSPPKDPITLLAEQLATITQRLDSIDNRFTTYDNSIVEINRKLVTAPVAGPHNHAGGPRTGPRFGHDSGGSLQFRNTGRELDGPTPFKMRLEQPQFNGDDPHTWIFKAEEYFDYYQVPADHRLRLASLMMTGDAASWYQYQRNNNLLHTWHHFVEEIKERFDSNYRKDFFGVLSKMCQTTTVSAFRIDFERVLNRVTNSRAQTPIEQGTRTAQTADPLTSLLVVSNTGDFDDRHFWGLADS